jgi:nickel/cobalt exporter
VFIASTAFLLGFLHGLGADHLLAIAALSIGEVAPAAAGSRRAMRVAMQFACGHALLLTVGAAGAAAVGWHWPIAFERVGERLAGTLLVALGVAGLWAVGTGRVYVHSHGQADPPQAHWHWHFGRAHRHPRPGRHRHLPTLLGAVFAVSGLRAMTTLAPLGSSGAAPSLLWVIGLILLFALGIVSSMALFGVVLARVLSSRAIAAVGRAAAFVTAAASLTLGLYWVMTS